MPLRFQYVPMNTVGIMGPDTDVLKTGGVGTCVVLLFQYAENDNTKYALAHVPYDSDKLVMLGRDGVVTYINSIYEILGSPSKGAMNVTVIQRRSIGGYNELTAYIMSILDGFGVNSVTFENYNTEQRLSVVFLKNESERHGRYICYASKKTEFIDESELAFEVSRIGMNIVSHLDTKSRAEKGHFRRHADLYANARESSDNYSQATNAYTLALLDIKAKCDQFKPVLASTQVFSREKRVAWTKKNPKPILYGSYIEWENRIHGRVLQKTV
ncbi:hypothetical protein [Agaribacterium sp. ZY112]|uniref:hypothetical protein n=1 Tax=Agaribacterium sp. ZY112 TaxID=3233574 RepID=UPI003524C1CC